MTNSYVRTDDGTYLVQLVDDSPWGFSLYSSDQSWPGGCGIAVTWETVNASKVPEEVRSALDWLLDLD